jgi:aconitate hydratase
MHKVKSKINVNGYDYTYFSFHKTKEVGLNSIDKLPRSLKILLENILRKLDDESSSSHWNDVVALNDWVNTRSSTHEISFYPSRVLMQDFTGVPAIVDLAAMREAIETLGGEAIQINPQIPVDLVIDHSIQVEHFGDIDSFNKNVDIEYQRNIERYEFLKWGQKSFANFRVVPPNTGIVHQINLEYFASVICKDESSDVIYPDTCVGTDSHTTMINGLSVLAWGVGGIEAEAAMMGQPISLIIPEVIGFKLSGKLKEGVNATDLVLTVTERLRDYGVVGKFVEFFGNGVKDLSLTDRATLGNMSPEYGVTCTYFPVDEKTIEYLHFTGRDEKWIQVIESYSKEQGLWAYTDEAQLAYTDVIELNLDDVFSCVAGPKRPQDKVALTNLKESFELDLISTFNLTESKLSNKYSVDEKEFTLKHGDIVIAAITSCTNTSNPSLMIAAGLLAQKAVAKGMSVKPWVKTSLAPGSKVVTDYLDKSKLQIDLNELGFNLVGYGCTTCIGNSGPLIPGISDTISKNDIIAVSVLSGNRNFEGRINPDVKANFLASPALVVAFALVGSIKVDLTKDSLGLDKEGKDVFLNDIWPSDKEVQKVIKQHITRKMYQDRYAHVFEGDKRWKDIKAEKTIKYNWNMKSTYIKKLPFFNYIKKSKMTEFKVENGRILALLGDSITTDHISPAGSIAIKSPAGKYLLDHSVPVIDFNSYGSRRGNFEIMTRGTFANIRIKNELLGGVESGLSKIYPTNEIKPIYDIAMEYDKSDIDLVIIAGKDYGTGSSRDWAAKGTKLQGVKAVIAESFERIHRSNLIGMGVMPLEFLEGHNRKSHSLDGSEKISIHTASKEFNLKKRDIYIMNIERIDGTVNSCSLINRIDTEDELNYFKSGGILEFVLRELIRENNEN